MKTEICPTCKRGKLLYTYQISYLIDRFTIAMLKSIYIQEYREKYLEEINLILHDLDILCKEKDIKLTSNIIQGIAVTMATNQCIWNNECEVRKGSSKQNHLLRFTHSINGIRNTAKNIINKEIGDRIDLKIDCLAEEFQTDKFTKEHGNWNLFEKKKKIERKKK